MKLGSLFDGSGTAPLAAAMCGIEPAWASEIEPFPIKVTTKRFPGMKHLGSILDIDGAVAEPVDIICGGSPCQDLSVAGKQAGLHNGERSHLFFEMTRIIREMREATNGEHPKYVIWENVPGAFSSNNGQDFRAVLQAFAEIAEPDAYVPRPASKGRTDRLDWKLSGTIVGDGWSIAWRTVDAQFWGVPQRRRRIYLVADLTGERAGEILFERKSVSGDSESCGAQRQGTAEDAEGSLGGSGDTWSLSKEQQLAIAYDITGTSSNSMKSPTPDSCFRERDVSRTLDSFVGSPDCNQGGTVVVNVYPDVARTLTAEHDASPCVDRGQNIAVTSAGFVGRQGAKSGSVGYEQEVCPTLRQDITTDVCYCLQGNVIDRNAAQNGSGVSEDTAPTINSVDRHGVAYTADCRNGVLNEEKSGTLQAKNQGGHSLNYINPVMIPYDMQAFGKYGDGQTGSALKQRDYKDATDLVVEPCIYPGVGITSKQNASNPQPGDPAPTISTDSRNYLVHNTKPPRRYIVRRLTPLECCRLQGFPDWWVEGCSEEYPVTHEYVDSNALDYIDPNGKIDGSDSAQYKMWGNGMALPNMLHVMRGIVDVENKQ